MGTIRYTKCDRCNATITETDAAKNWIKIRCAGLSISYHGAEYVDKSFFLVGLLLHRMSENLSCGLH